jgi:hypothetical protein
MVEIPFDLPDLDWGSEAQGPTGSPIPGAMGGDRPPPGGVLGTLGTVVGETDGHQDIASFAELAQLQGSKVTDLIMTSTTVAGEEMTVHVGLRHAEVSYSSPALEFIGALNEIRFVLLRHWRNWSLADTGGVLILGLPLMLVIFLGARSLARPPGAPDELIFLGALALAIVGMALIWNLTAWLRRRRFVLLPMIRYEDRPPSFLKRRGEDIAIQLAVGVIAGLIVGYWLGVSGVGP